MTDRKLKQCLVLFLGVGVLLSTVTARADFLGVYVGAGYWNQGVGGDAIADVSLKDELRISDTSGLQAYVRFEHPIPLVPNIRVARSEISDSSVGLLTNPVTFNGVPFVSGQTVTSSIDMSHTDVTLYYEIVDIGIDLDVGLTGRIMDGELGMGGVIEQTNTILPLIYLAGKAGLPFSGLYLAGDVNGLGIGDAKIADYSLKLGWETDSFILPEVGVELGYRRFVIDAAGSDIDFVVDMDVDGFFLNLTGHF